MATIQHYSPQPSLFHNFVSAGMAACVAETITFPLDTAKVRLQLQGERAMPNSTVQVGPTTSMKYRGLLHALRTIATEEGIRGLYKGLVPGLQRQLCFSSIRLGLYDECKKFYMMALYTEKNPRDVPLSVRIIAGVTTGSMSVMLAQPTDVVKIRMQGQGTSSTRIYRNSVEAYRCISTNEGIRGLWKGVAPNIVRNIAVGVTELVIYDTAKHEFVKHKVLNDGIPCHFLSAVVASFITVVISSPIDVIKTRYMNSNPGQYTGVLNCAYELFQANGLYGYYKGCVPYFARICSWGIIMFLSYEQMKSLLAPKRTSPHVIPVRL